MGNMIEGDQLRKLLFGRQVTYDPGTLPQSGSTAIFAISGGRVAITSLIGNVTTAIQNQGCNLSVGLSPSTGTASGTSIGGTAAIGNLPAGGQVFLGTTQGAVLGTAVAASPAVIASTPIVVQSGTIYAVTTASNTGDIAWAMTYVPVDTGASVAAG